MTVQNGLNRGSKRRNMHNARWRRTQARLKMGHREVNQVTHHLRSLLHQISVFRWCIPSCSSCLHILLFWQKSSRQPEARTNNMHALSCRVLPAATEATRPSCYEHNSKREGKKTHSQLYSSTMLPRKLAQNIAETLNSATIRIPNTPYPDVLQATPWSLMLL